MASQKLFIIGSTKGLSPVRRQAVTGTNADSQQGFFNSREFIWKYHMKMAVVMVSLQWID